jgi:hydroxysqualene synthase
MPLPLAPAEPPADSASPVPIHLAYRACEEIARRHYENFPVATRFLTPERRLALAAIYAFARVADDIADASAPTAERLAALDAMEAALLHAADGEPEGAVLVALADAIERHELPVEPFLDLLAAFRDDARNRTFASWDDLLGYCRGSANPIGRLVLHVHGIDDPRSLTLSDHVCTALQLTNFWQDLAADLERGRVFFPMEDLKHFGLAPAPAEIRRPSSRAALSRLLTHECRATDELFERGRPITRAVPFRLSVQLRATIAGGRSVLRGVERAGWRVLRARPTVGTVARTRIVILSLLGIDG